jgi:hypothetical protein
MSKNGLPIRKEMTVKEDGVSGQQTTTKTLLRLCATFEGVTGIVLMAEPDFIVRELSAHRAFSRRSQTYRRVCQRPPMAGMCSICGDSAAAGGPGIGKRFSGKDRSSKISTSVELKQNALLASSHRSEKEIT